MVTLTFFRKHSIATRAYLNTLNLGKVVARSTRPRLSGLARGNAVLVGRQHGAITLWGIVGDLP